LSRKEETIHFSFESIIIIIIISVVQFE